jgi:hypothetical protein
MLQVRLHSLANATPQGRELADRAVALLQQIVNDPQFLAQVRAARYSYSARMIDSGDDVAATDNETTAQIVAGGKEIKRSPDGVIDLTVVLRKFSIFYPNTMGSVTPPNHTISTNRKFFNRWLQSGNGGDALSLAAHWMHEWMHVAGFYHDTSSGDPNDVPYAIGEIATRVGQSFADPSAMDSADGFVAGESYLEAARAHTCAAVPGGPPADLFDDSDDPESEDLTDPVAAGTL